MAGADKHDYLGNGGNEFKAAPRPYDEVAVTPGVGADGYAEKDVERTTSDGLQQTLTSKSDDLTVPTDEELEKLRRVAGTVAMSSWIVIFVELCERFTFYGLSGPFQNYMQNAHGSHAAPGWLGLGQAKATALNLFFQFWCYITPLIGAIIADQYLGRYKTILIFIIVYIVGQIVLTMTSIPASNAKYPGLILAMIIIGLGTGGIKSNISSLTVEQNVQTRPHIKVLKSGERVIVDPSATRTRVFTYFYWGINLGGLSAIATSNLEKHVEFWAAYLLPLCMFIVGFFVFSLSHKKIVKVPPEGSIIPKTVKAISLAVRSGFNLEAGKAANLAPGYVRSWDDLFIEELRRSLFACKVFLFYPIFWLCYSQMQSNIISQAATMSRGNVPNDLLFNFNNIAIIIAIPIMDRIVYPTLRRYGFRIRPIPRITLGFFVTAVAMAYTSVIQHFIYKSPPYYDHVGSSDSFNDINVWIQIPSYVLIALSEIFTSITGLEFAYSKAPASMKSIVSAIFLLTNAFGSLLGMAVAPLAVDPKLVWMYAGIAIAAWITGTIVWLLFRKYNKEEDQQNALDYLVKKSRRQAKANNEKV